MRTIVEEVNFAKDCQLERLAIMQCTISDPAIKTRRQKQLCRVCFYSQRITTRGFTRYTCLLCEDTFSHHNGDLPRVCMRCAEKARLCKRCGCDMEYENRRVVKGYEKSCTQEVKD